MQKQAAVPWKMNVDVKLLLSRAKKWNALSDGLFIFFSKKNNRWGFVGLCVCVFKAMAFKLCSTENAFNFCLLWDAQSKVGQAHSNTSIPLLYLLLILSDRH